MTATLRCAQFLKCTGLLVGRMLRSYSTSPATSWIWTGNGRSQHFNTHHLLFSPRFDVVRFYRYLNAGSSGVLSKPTNPQDVIDLLQCQLSVFLSNGTAVADANGFVTTPDSTFCFCRIKPICFDPDEDIPVFVPGLTAATSVANSVSQDAARELLETMSKLTYNTPVGSGSAAPMTAPARALGSSSRTATPVSCRPGVSSA